MTGAGGPPSGPGARPADGRGATTGRPVASGPGADTPPSGATAALPGAGPAPAGGAEPLPSAPPPAARPTPPVFDRRMLEYLVCPVTHAPLTYDAERQELVSRAVHLAFPIRGGIPILLADEAREVE